MLVSITGGSGFIGRKLVERHLAQGDAVRILSRREPHEISLPREVAVFRADLTDGAAALREFVEGADVLYHCAGEIRDPSRMRPLHVEGTRNLLQAAESRIGRWVQLSSVGVYGPQREGIVTERTAPNPVGEYEITKTESDREVMETAERRKISYAVLRPSNVYGAGMSNRYLHQMTAMIKQGLFFFIGKPGASANYIHVDNVVKALRLCGQAPAADGRVYNLSDDVPLERFAAIIAEALGKPAPRLRVPEALARWPANTAARLGLRLPLTPARIDALTIRATYSSERIMKELAYVHEVSMRDGLRRFVAESGA